MPTQPATPCAQPGCPVLVYGASRCAAHKVERRKDPEQARFYGSSRWQSIRSLIRHRDPLCVMCSREPSKIVDHIDGDWRNNDPSNLRGLCAACNASHTGRQHQGKR